MPVARATPRRLWSSLARPLTLRWGAGLSVVAVAVGIVSGGTVRLTGSGLGCRDWPSCTSTSIIAPFQYHAWVEFGNRLVNVVITVAVALVALAALRRRPRRWDLLALASALVAGVLAEVVLGGVTVLEKLAPQFVMAHFLLAVALLVASVALHHRSRLPEELGPASRGAGGPQRAYALPARPLVQPPLVVATRAMWALSLVVVALGTIVTSTGPHAGAPGVARFGFSLHTVAQLHGTSVELLLALTVATLWAMHRARAPVAVLRRGEGLLVVLVAQAAVGYSQYLSGDPSLLVGLHLAGATAVVIAMTVFNLGLYEHAPNAATTAEPPGSELARELAAV